MSSADYSPEVATETAAPVAQEEPTLTEASLPEAVRTEERVNAASNEDVEVDAVVNASKEANLEEENVDAEQEELEKPQEEIEEEDEEYDPLAEYDPTASASTTAAVEESIEAAAQSFDSIVNEQQSKVSSDENDNDYVANEPEAEEESDEPEIDVVSFNEIVSWFITTPLFQDPNFAELKPAEKEKTVLDEYNKTFNKNVRVKLNFDATTSYNKAFLKSNEKREFLIPMNPFCLRPDLLTPMTPKEKESFNRFMQNEDGSLKSGKWDNFPIGSRLFIGNLAVNTLTKQDVFRVFNAYGEIAQVNLKQGFGFVQFQTAEACSRAIQGEKNVPLHNKLMHLEVSKHQIKRAINQDSSSARDRSPTRGNGDNVRSRSPIRKPSVNDVKIILTLDSSPLFEKKLTKRLTQDGISYVAEKFEVSFDNVPSDVLTNAAYEGITVVLVTCGNDLLNVTAYESTPDGGIKFDEYTEISIDSSIEIILTAKAKKAADQPREYHLQQRQERERNNRNGRNTYDRGRDRDRDRGRGGRGRDNNNNNNNNNNSNSNNSNYNNRNYRNGNQAIYGVQNNGRDGDRNRRGGRSNDNDDYNNVRYSKQQRYLQQHAPVQVGTGYNQSPPPPINQMSQQPQSNQLLQQLSSVDPNTLQSMLSLVQQYQGQGQTQPQQPQRGRNQYYPPQPSNNSGNAQLNGLLSQLQNANPQQQMYGNQSLPPQNQQFSQYNQPPSHSHSQHLNNSNSSNPLLNSNQGMNNSRGGYNNNNNNSSTNDNNNDQSQSSSDLFETLSRLRNNV